jgi:protein-histidine pros-kinase
MVKKYGTANGFGWNANQVITAQIVTVPMAVAIRAADKAFQRLMFFLVATFVISIVAFDAVLYTVVIRPLAGVCSRADKISKGETDVDELEVRGKDEIADVTASFNRMHRSLTKALKMLEQ